jgi:hypothetical protein
MESAPPSPFAPSVLAALETTYAPLSTSKGDLLSDDYLLAHDGRYSVYYAPFHAWPTRETLLVLVGLTPGFSQVRAAAQLFCETPETVRRDARAYNSLLRKHVAFRGSMRTNLCDMLDALKFPEYFGVAQSEDVFRDADTLVATTSALLYPVFSGSELRNFSGSGKDLANVPLFRRMLEELLAPRLAAAPDALIVPFGKAASSGVRYLSDTGAVRSERVLIGFPHPSGANGHRKRYFEEQRENLDMTLVKWFGRT